jgi:hypothetical protein
MVHCPVFREFAGDVIARGAAEIGMHLHAWNSPPVVPLTEDDFLHHPYLPEYPEDQMRAKVRVLTEALEDTFGRKMVSHRAGRWGFDSRYARILAEAGYLVDCSVTPHLSWKAYKGDPNGRGGPDFTDFPATAYFLDLEDISRPGNSSLLEVPMTVGRPENPVVQGLHRLLRNAPRLLRAPVNRLFPPRCRLEPDGRNLRQLLRILRRARAQGKDYVEFTLHSSEFMPGGSPKFPSEERIEGLYRHLEALFESAQGAFAGLTLQEYYRRFTTEQAASREGAGHPAPPLPSGDAPPFLGAVRRSLGDSGRRLGWELASACRSMDRWLVPYVARWPRRRVRRPGAPVHVLLCIADHFEPGRGGVRPEVARARVTRWVEEYPRLFERFRDGDGRPPRHTFFYPMEKYEPEHIELLARLCRAGFGEVEVHLHHDGDTEGTLRQKLVRYKALLSEGHGLLPRSRKTGDVAYGFIHGDWALCNSGPGGQGCGVNDELTVLRDTGCYADFTFPSAPHPTQPRLINSIYYARSNPGRPRGYDCGTELGPGPAPAGALMLIQGPLLLDWGRRKWGLAPRIENGCLQGNQPPTEERLALWLRANVHVPARPDWVFVKLHTHGAPESNQKVLLGEAMVRLHESLARHAGADPALHFHYVTAREMFNLARAAEAGWPGSVAEARDYELVWNGRATGGPDDPVKHRPGARTMTPTTA